MPLVDEAVDQGIHVCSNIGLIAGHDFGAQMRIYRTAPSGVTRRVALFRHQQRQTFRAIRLVALCIGEGLPVLANATHVFIAADPPVSGPDVAARHRAVAEVGLERIDKLFVELGRVVVEISEDVPAETRFEFFGSWRARLHFDLGVTARDGASSRLVHRSSLRCARSAIKQTLVWKTIPFGLPCQGTPSGAWPIFSVG